MTKTVAYTVKFNLAETIIFETLKNGHGYNIAAPLYDMVSREQLLLEILEITPASWSESSETLNIALSEYSAALCTYLRGHSFITLGTGAG